MSTSTIHRVSGDSNRHPDAVRMTLTRNAIPFAFILRFHFAVPPRADPQPSADFITLRQMTNNG